MYELGVIGLGHIGVPIVNGALSGKAVSPDQVILYGHHPERLEPLLLAGASAAKNEIEVASSCHYLLLSLCKYKNQHAQHAVRLFSFSVNSSEQL